MPAREANRNDILTKLNDLNDLPTLPAIAQRIISLAQSPSVSYKELKKVILTDPPLAAKVVRGANSVMMGRRTPAKNVDEALVTLGLDNLLAICNSVGILQALDAWKAIHFDRRLLWRHALATGFLAKSLEFRKLLETKSGPDLFLCGLLHNIGWVVLDHIVPNLLAAAFKTTSEIHEWSINIERELIGMDHGEVGGRFLQKWELPEDICMIVRFHHQPQLAGENAAFAGIVQIATSLSPHPFLLDIKFDSVNENVPYNLKHRVGEAAIRDMELHYGPNIHQAEVMADMLLGWL